MSIGDRLPRQSIPGEISLAVPRVGVYTAPETREEVDRWILRGAVYARVCPLVWLRASLPTFYVPTRTHTYLHSRGCTTLARFSSRVSVCVSVRAGALARLLTVHDDSPDPPHTLFYTHRNTCVARTTNSGVSSKTRRHRRRHTTVAAAATATASVPSFRNRLADLGGSSGTCILSYYVRSSDRDADIPLFECLFGKGKLLQQVYPRIPRAAPIAESTRRLGLTRLLAYCSLRAATVRSFCVSLRVRLARVTDELEVDDERQARSV